MKLGVVVDRLEVGGVEKVAIHQVLSLRQLGHDVDLVLLRERGDGLTVFADELRKVPVRVLERRLPRWVRWSVPVPGFSFLQTFHVTYPAFARTLVQKGEFDALLAHGTYTAITALAAGRRQSIPVAAFVWDPTYHVLSSGAYSERSLRHLLPVLLPVARRFDRWLAKRADLVVLGGREYQAYFEAAGARRTIISYPAATPVEAPLDVTSREPEMLAVTAWKRGKNPARLLELLERTDDLKLVLAGAWLDLRVRQEFEQEVERRGLKRRVGVTGPLSEEDLTRRYAKARFAIQTWPSPGFGLSPLEAAASGTTFIAPRAQGSGEIFRDGTHGFLFDAGDSEAVIEAVDRLAADPQLAVEMGTQAWNFVSEHHTWSARASQLADALASMGQGPELPRGRSPL
jgi:glycosyltransferase involved in cell wall biosynthesis